MIEEYLVFSTWNKNVKQFISQKEVLVELNNYLLIYVYIQHGS